MKIFFPECGVGNPEHFLLLETEPVEWGKAPCSRTPGSTSHFYFFVQNYQSSKTSDFSALTPDFAWTVEKNLPGQTARNISKPHNTGEISKEVQFLYLHVPKER